MLAARVRMKPAAIAAACSATFMISVPSSRAGRKHKVPVRPKLLDRPPLVVSSGLASFVDPGLRTVAGVGETWSARVAAGRPQGVRVEVAYTGSAQQLEPAEGSWLIGHGVVG